MIEHQLLVIACFCLYLRRILHLLAGTWDKIKGRYLGNKKGSRNSSTLNSVTFKAKPGEITAIISSEMSERRTLSQLLVQRRQFGNFDGQICISGKPMGGHDKITNAFVSREAKKLYTPGLSYEDMIHYAARLRMPFASRAEIKKHVDDILELMELTVCRKRVIPQVPEVRGAIGGELRRVSIACEIVTKPELIVLDDPTRNLDMSVANLIFERLNVLASQGHTVIAAVSSPSPQTFQHIESVVLMYEGYSIFAGNKKNLVPYFSSIDYNVSNDTNIVEFLMDVAEGTERCRGKRQKDIPNASLLHINFEKSAYTDKMDASLSFTAILPETTVKRYGYFQGGSSLAARLYRSFTAFERAFWVKMWDHESTKKSIGANTIVGLLIGYFDYGTGEFGQYSKQLFFPYNQASNCAALLFIISVYVIVQQISGVHTVCQKMRVFRYEQKADCCPLFGMWIATIVSEAFFGVIFMTYFASVLFFMTDLNSTAEMPFYLATIAMQTMVGCAVATSLAGVFRAEIVVRDVFVFYLFGNIMLSGYPFQMPAMTDDARALSYIDPMRWCFETLMVWKYLDYVDGVSFLTPYDHQNFDKSKIFGILFNFLIFFNGVLLLTMIPPPNTLTRKLRELTGAERRAQKARRASVEATDFSDEDLTDDQMNELQRQKTPQKPLLFSRETYVTGMKSELSCSNSSLGLTDVRNTVGPKIEFDGLSYMLKDKKAPLGYRPLLSNITGTFQSSRLSVIMGCAQSGKSSLLSLLGGNAQTADSTMLGTIHLNGCPYDRTVKPWQRCAYVDAVDVHYRDLSVLDLLTYAALLRCSTTLGLAVAEKHVSLTMALMHLTEVADKKTKHLTRGGLRRLSIAEEVVQGLPLLFVDEPVTEVGKDEAALIMSSLREMVNQQRTVVMTCHLPSAEIFALFDDIVLLSKGCMVYCGPAKEAIGYFTTIPHVSFGDAVSLYVNPADFLTDISACHLHTADGAHVDTPSLELFFKSSKFCRGEKTYFNERTSFDKSEEVTVSDNPLLKGKARAASTKKMERMSIEAPRGSSVYNAAAIETVVFSKWSVETCLVGCFSACFGAVYELLWLSPVLLKSRARILLLRALKVLFYREKLVLGAIAVHMLIAFTFSFITGDLSQETGNVLTMYGLGCMLLIIANVTFGFFLWTNNQVCTVYAYSLLYMLTVYAMLCCAMLCCAMLCCAMLCYAVLCCAMLCYAAS
jgi:ATP-binding cassette subfamily G (WHITE) protein 2 (SNQ2)